MSRYVNPYTDFGFKKLFGEEASKDLLVDFLDTFLPAKHRIKTLTFRNTEQLGPGTLDRKAIYDIYCEAENGEKFIVEMQKAKQFFFRDRAVFYSTWPIREQAERGDNWNFELKAVYYVAILDFEYDAEEERRKFHREVMLKDQDGDLFYEKLQYIFLQMPLFKKTESELETHRDKWLYFLKNLVNFDDIPGILKEPIFERAFATAEIARFDKADRMRYEANLKVYRDNYAVEETAYIEAVAKGRAEGLAEGKAEGLAEGLAEGKAEGLAEGKEEEKLEIARNMKNDGVSVELILKYTGLSIEEVETLD